MLLNNEWVNQEVKEEIKKYMEINENENTMVQNIWDVAKKSSKREVDSHADLPQEAGKKSQINSLNLYLKELEKEQTEPNTSRRNEMIKIRAEINNIETKKIK